jgi:hypothetical protein
MLAIAMPRLPKSKTYTMSRIWVVPTTHGVNQIKLAPGQAEPLKEGDIVKFGKVELTFHES